MTRHGTNVFVIKARKNLSYLIREKMSIASTGHKIRLAGGWLKRRKLAVVSLLVIWALLSPNTSQSQFLPSPCCAILSAGLSSVASAITNVIGGGLNAIRSTISSIESFQRSIVWPVDLIIRAKNVVGSVQVIFDQVRGIEQISVSSATLPDSQLEHVLLSRNTTQMDSVSAHY